MSLEYQPLVSVVISSLKNKELFEIANLLGIPPAAIAGALAEEYSSSLQHPYSEMAQCERVMFSLYDIFGHINENNHHDILSDYQAVIHPDNIDMLEDPDPVDKGFHVTLNDIGIGNLKISTVIGLFTDYLREHNDGSDPLGLRIFENRYDLLIGALLDDNYADYTTLPSVPSDTPLNERINHYFDNITGRTDHTYNIIFAGLMLKEGQDFYSKECPLIWSILDDDTKNAILVTYYNLGANKTQERLVEGRNEYKQRYLEKFGVEYTSMIQLPGMGLRTGEPQYIPGRYGDTISNSNVKNSKA